MKMKKIVIKDFKGIVEKDVTFEDGKITALLGHNGYGKSSFIEALRFALTGVTPQNPIRDGAKSAYVEIEMDDGTVFSRTIYRKNKPTKVTVNGKTTPAKNLNALIRENFGFEVDALKIATSADILSAMRSDELGDFLLRYIPEKLSITEILGFISDPTEEMQEAVFLALPDRDFDISDVNVVYESFMEVRKNVKKDLDYLKLKISKLPEAEPSRKLAIIQKDLELLCEKEGATKAAVAMLKMYDSIKSKRNEMLINVAEMQKKYDDIEASRPTPLFREKLDNEQNSAYEQLNEAETMIKIMESSIKTFQDTLERLDTNHCPLSDSIICTTDKSNAKNEIKSVIKSNEDGIAIQRSKTESLRSRITEISTAISEYEANERAYKEKLLMAKQIEKIKKAIPELPKKPDEHSISSDTDYEREKSILREEMEYAKKWDERNILLGKVEETEKSFLLYDKLCDAFAPKGEVMTKILSSYLSFFENEINKKAEMLRDDMKVEFVPENGIKYYIKINKDSEFHLYDELSKGEKTLAIFLLLDLISSLCGTKIMILDDLNNLDQNSLKEIINIVSNPEYKKEYDHIFFASIDSTDVISLIKPYDADIQRV